MAKLTDRPQISRLPRSQGRSRPPNSADTILGATGTRSSNTLPVKPRETAVEAGSRPLSRQGPGSWGEWRCHDDAAAPAPVRSLPRNPVVFHYWPASTSCVGQRRKASQGQGPDDRAVRQQCANLPRDVVTTPAAGGGTGPTTLTAERRGQRPEPAACHDEPAATGHRARYREQTRRPANYLRCRERVRSVPRPRREPSGYGEQPSPRGPTGRQIPRDVSYSGIRQPANRRAKPDDPADGGNGRATVGSQRGPYPLTASGGRGEPTMRLAYVCRT